MTLARVKDCNFFPANNQIHLFSSSLVTCQQALHLIHCQQHDACMHIGAGDGACRDYSTTGHAVTVAAGSWVARCLELACTAQRPLTHRLQALPA